MKETYSVTNIFWTLYYSGGERGSVLVIRFRSFSPFTVLFDSGEDKSGPCDPAGGLCPVGIFEVFLANDQMRTYKKWQLWLSG